jgi:flagellar FliJ protein
MAKFVFRVQAALDMRRKQEDEAKQALAAAETRRREAQGQFDQAHDALQATLARATDAEHQPGDVNARVWYRNWIGAQRLELERRRAIVAARDADVRDAKKLAQEAYKKRRILERLKDRSHTTFLDAERREEQKMFDELGSLRFSIDKRGGIS